MGRGCRGHSSLHISRTAGGKPGVFVLAPQSGSLSVDLQWVMNLTLLQDLPHPVDSQGLIGSLLGECLGSWSWGGGVQPFIKSLLGVLVTLVYRR